MYKITLLAIFNRPDEAAEVLSENTNPRCSSWGILDQGVYTRGGWALECRTMVRYLINGTPLVVEVESQRELNALAGYFWVEPRRLPIKEKYHDDL